MPVPDRVVGQQALVLAFAAEHDLPLTVVPEIIKLAQELSTDSTALKHFAVDRTTASYKLAHGSAQTIDELNSQFLSVKTVLIKFRRVYMLNQQPKSKYNSHYFEVLVFTWGMEASFALHRYYIERSNKTSMTREFTPSCDHAIMHLQFQLYLSLQPLHKSDMIFLLLCAFLANKVKT